MASAVAGTQWMVLVTATGQVTVGRADVQYVGVVAGRVTDRVTTQPIENVQVTIEGTRLGQATDAEGRFAIAGVPAGPQRVAVRRIGYDPQSSVVIVTDGATQTADFSLAHSAASLAEVVVTATGEERTRAIGNSLTVVDLAAEKVPLANTQEMLAGRVPGVPS